MSKSIQAIFLSYASQDADAAARICDALRAGGLEVWFDQSKLRGGDAWDASIRRQIRECALFVPLISANTDERSEGYFRLEWKLAVDRSHLIADDQSFLLPVFIDSTVEATARVPDRFRERQWTRLPNGETPPEFVERLRQLIAGLPAPVSATSASQVATSATPSRVGNTATRRPRAWLLGGAAIAVAFKARKHTRSFGAGTCGVSTGRSRFYLSDGSVLLLTTAVFADCRRVRYGHSLAPDEPLQPTEVVPRAIRWIREEYKTKN